MTATIETNATIDLPIEDLRAAVAGAVLLPGAPGYAVASTPWNVAVPATPVAIMVAATAADVVAAVRFATTHGLRVSVQATGHGAVHNQVPTLMIQTSALDELAVRSDGAVRAGAGVRWDAVIDACAAHGLAGLAGSAPNVGVVGYLTGGGLGPVARTYGVSADYVTAFDVVTGDGELRRVTPTDNSALFWGLRGGKGALGIVTAVEFTAPPLAEIYGGCVYFDAESIGAVSRAWRLWSAELPDAASTSIAIMRLPAMPDVPEPLAGQVTAALRFAWVGDPAEGQRTAEAILAAGRIVLGGFDVMPYAAVGAIHADPIDPMPIHESSGLIDELTAEAVERFVELAGPGSPCPQIIVELRLLGGAIAREPQHASAYSHRAAGYSFLAIGVAAPPVLHLTLDYAEQLAMGLSPWLTGDCLPNFAATSEPVEIARKYDRGTLARLATLTATYDPHGVIAAGWPVREAALLAN